MQRLEPAVDRTGTKDFAGFGRRLEALKPQVCNLTDLKKVAHELMGRCGQKDGVWFSNSLQSRRQVQGLANEATFFQTVAAKSVADDYGPRRYPEPQSKRVSCGIEPTHIIEE